ncbi:hypothetical protein [Desulfoscipio gibsoniae]|uniref:Uncharacterized protein n=1 Tax=Desulfoscipio gibsoniae DSM 7213 TaxID=767817 RepID=R4KC39_9FIRM|nr:hypothetical protein [Desulfoscipio gibsoniae]AGL00129.1 hypothetical protein Desgi_0567 [Desulfoscipio gibsoniae DSM 7213]
MTNRDCEACPVKELQKIHRLVEKRVLEKLPEEMREPLLEAKRQMRLALRGLIGHVFEEKKACNEKHPVESRRIDLD